MTDRLQLRNDIKPGILAAGLSPGASTLRSRGLGGPAADALVLGVPIAPHETVNVLRTDLDEIICLSKPAPFFRFGMHYVDRRAAEAS